MGTEVLFDDYASCFSYTDHGIGFSYLLSSFTFYAIRNIRTRILIGLGGNHVKFHTSPIAIDSQ